MNRTRQEPEQFLPSTTRAVAWGALFFSLIACVLSAFTLFITWRDGRLVRNTRQFTDEMGQLIERVRRDRPGQESNPQWDAMHARLERVQEMIRQGDVRARSYLDSINQDIKEWRKDPRLDGATWLSEASEKLQSVREGIMKDAPEAARRLKAITGELQTKFQSLRKTTAPSAERTENTAPVAKSDGERD